MKKYIGVAFAGLIAAVAPASADPLPKRDYDKEIKVCVPSYIAKYAVLCETAEIAARGVAYACSPKPMPRGPAAGEPNSRSETYLAFSYMIEESAYEFAYAKALVGILDARVIKQPVCQQAPIWQPAR
jgi:hypothetical protein